MMSDIDESSSSNRVIKIRLFEAVLIAITTAGLTSFVSMQIGGEITKERIANMRKHVDLQSKVTAELMADISVIRSELEVMRTKLVDRWTRTDEMQWQRDHIVSHSKEMSELRELVMFKQLYVPNPAYVGDAINKGTKKKR